MSVEAPERRNVLQARVKLHNHFLAEVRDAKTGKLVRRAEAENVVTNAGRQFLASNTFEVTNSFMFRCLVGIGTASANPTDTILGSQKTWANMATSSQVANPDTAFADNSTSVYYRRRKYQFEQGVANFSLTEVGLSTGGGDPGVSQDTTTPQGIMTRALFKDALGNPIAITKTSSQILTVTATVFLVRGSEDSNMRLLNNWMSRQVTSPGSLTFSKWFLGTGTAAPSRSDTTLSGSQLAVRNGGADSGFDNARNRVFWDGSVWQTSRPSSMLYVTTHYIDWGINEANGTFSEVLVQDGVNFFTMSGAMVRLIFPCGNVGGSSYTKDNTHKLRQYFEIAWV